MNRYVRGLQLLCLAGILILAAGLAWSQTKGQTQNPPQKKGVEQKQAETDQDYTEEEYNAYEAASKETDPVKQGAMVVQFLEKYPKSTLKPHVTNLYETLLFNVSKAGDYKNLGPLAEQWLKLNPNDLKCQAYIFDSAVALAQHQKVVDYGEKIYAQNPIAKIALAIYQAYDKLGNKAKKEEWALKLLQYPEFSNDIQLRMELVAEYAGKDLPKAAGYCEDTLKALPGASKPAAMSDEDWSKAQTSVKKTCHNLTGMNYFTQKKYPQAIEALIKAIDAVGKNLATEKYDDGFYYIGESQWRQENAEDAYLSFAIAAQINGPLAAKAQKNSLDLYKSQRNGTDVGYNKVENKAKSILDALVKGAKYADVIKKD